ncbi:TPA: hypothetical protein ACGO3A_001152 [Streptococcus suis]
MARDKNEEQRYLLTQKMNELEMKEDEFAQLMKHYEQSLEQFHARFQQLIRRQEGLLEEQSMERSQQFWADLDTNQELYRRMTNYVDACFAEVGEAKRIFRRVTNERLEQLYDERSKLPWD